MRRFTWIHCFAVLLLPGWVQAQTINCASVPLTMPLSNAILAPVASELPSSSSYLGASDGVLAQAFDEAQSVEQVLLRMRIESCKNVAKIIPAPGAVDPLDPATYKPRTQFDNAPWRFNMTQNGKRMTADEFSAWMQSRGVRVAKGITPPAPVAPVQTADMPVPVSPPGMPANAQPPPPAPATQPPLPASGQ